MRKLKVALMLCSVVVFASEVRAQNAPGTNNAELNGNYAFTFNGISGSGGAWSVFGAVGRFTADGAGNVTNGVMDTNGIGSGATRVAQTFTGTYSIGADHRGVMNIQGGGRLAFAMMANGNAQFIQFDAGGGIGTIGSGTMEKADTTAYDAAKIIGDYAFGMSGLDNLNSRAAMAGRFTSGGSGSLTNAAGDVNAYGALYPMSSASASYTVSNTVAGRGTMNFSFTLAGGPASLNFVFYIVSAGKLFAMERDTVTTATPLFNGVVQRQQSPPGGFSNAALRGGMVIYLTGLSKCGDPTATIPKAVVGLINADGNGAFGLSYDENYCRVANSVNVSGAYSVASNGRQSITLGGNEVLAAYMVNSNQALLIGTDDNVLFGFGEPQQAKSLTNSDVKGTYAGSTMTPANFDVVTFSGEFTADGAGPNGNITGTADVSSSGGLISSAPFTATYSVSASPINGRTTMSVTSGSGGTDLAYVISSSKFVAVPFNDENPAVMIFEQSSPASSPVPPSITTQPSSQTVTAGQTATFTVAASGTAPLSYQWQKNGTPVGGNSPSYTTPPTTTGDNGAQFTVVVSNSAGSTTSNAATLTVNSAAVPPSITTQPSSQTVTAGQTATFTVTAMGTAPLSYQWQKNGTPVGGNSPSYTTPPTTTGDNGAQFTVVITNSAGSVTSNAATLTVNAPRFMLTVTNNSGLGSGTITSSPAGINCGSNCSASYVGGTTVILTAHPNMLSAIDSWTGCDVVSADRTTCTVNMNAARSVAASFKLLGLF